MKISIFFFSCSIYMFLTCQTISTMRAWYHAVSWSISNWPLRGSRQPLLKAINVVYQSLIAPLALTIILLITGSLILECVHKSPKIWQQFLAKFIFVILTESTALYLIPSVVVPVRFAMESPLQYAYEVEYKSGRSALPIISDLETYQDCTSHQG